VKYGSTIYIYIFIYLCIICCDNNNGSANSKYAFLGSIRSTAQLIAYELVLSSAILIVIMLAGSLNMTVIIESQRAC
jgi:NADH:ubiquinone oxidoreductase subunit H